MPSSMCEKLSSSQRTLSMDADTGVCCTKESHNASVDINTQHILVFSTIGCVVAVGGGLRNRSR